MGASNRPRCTSTLTIELKRSPWDFPMRLRQRTLMMSQRLPANVLKTFTPCGLVKDSSTRTGLTGVDATTAIRGIEVMRTQALNDIGSILASANVPGGEGARVPVCGILLDGLGG